MPPLLAYLPTPDLLWHFDQVTRDHLSAFATPSVEEAKRMLERADVGALVLEPKDDSGRTTLPLISYLAERRPTLPIVLYSTIDPSAVRFVTEITRHSSNIRHVVLHRFDDAPHRFRSLLRSLEQNKETAPPIESRVTVVGDTISQELIDYLLSEAGQTYFVEETFEYPMIEGVGTPADLPALDELETPEIDLNDLDDLQRTIEMITEAGLL